MTENNTETIVKLHPKSVKEIYSIALELNKNLVDAIINEMKKQNYEFTIQLMNDLKEKKMKDEKLYSLKEISKVLKIPYGTITHFDLPFRKTENSPKKMYYINEVTEYLNSIGKLKNGK